MKTRRMRGVAALTILLAAGSLLPGCQSTRPESGTAADLGPGAAAGAAPPRFNEYILRAVDLLANDPNRVGRGYGPGAFTQDLGFGDQGVLTASPKVPQTMCVAAQLEVLVEALRLYSTDKTDPKPYTFLPKKTWERLGPKDLRGEFWLVSGANSSGAADALTNRGMGAKVTFETLKPRNFVNFNRANGSGHGVVFLNYLDRAGNELPNFSTDVAGFKYFSSQGKATTGGLGYRYAFFHPECPNNLPPGKQRDCGVIRSASQRMLNTGYAAMPTSWRHKDPAALAATAPEGKFDEGYFTGETTDE